MPWAATVNVDGIIIAVNKMGYDILVEQAESSGEVPPDGEKIVYGGVEMLKYIVPAGAVLVSHCHGYDHPSILASGEVELWTPARIQKLTGPIEVKIPAGVKHAVSALTDIVWYCLRSA
jgi:quercetin dioxygenase-like cupin family protein